MPQIKKVKLRCFCAKTFNGNQKSKNVVVSKGLSQHLNSSDDCRSRCGAIRFHNKSMNLINFLVNNNVNDSRKRKASIHPSLPECTLDDLGLTGTSNGPFPPGFPNPHVHKRSNHINHSLLNNQTLFEGNQQAISRDNIQALLLSHADNDSNHVCNDV